MMKLAMLHNRPFVIEGETTGRMIKNAATILEALEVKATWQLGEIQPYTMAELDAPIQTPQQIFAVGMNYRDHSAEIHIELPKAPSIFTKFSSSIAAPVVDVKAHGPQTDWETEIVAVVGQAGRDIATEDAMNYVAGVMVGEDLSDREVQFQNAKPQFSMGKSFENYAPIGPWLTTVDELGNLDDEVITTKVNGAVMQEAPLSQMIFKIPELVHYLSTVVELRPGDLIFTGTPSGTGVGHEPQIFLKPGDELTGEITHLGQLRMTIK